VSSGVYHSLPHFVTDTWSFVPSFVPAIRNRAGTRYDARVPIIRVDDRDDERLAVYRNVPDAHLLAQGGLFVAEGRLVVRRLIEARRFRVRSVMVTDAAFIPLRGLLDTHQELPVYIVPQAVMNGITGFNMHRGCLAIGERPRSCSWRDVLRGARRAIALERIGNADNVGSLFRSAAAFGVDAVLLEASCTDPLYRKAIRTSMGAALTMPFATAEPWPGVLRELARDGWVVAGMTPSPTALTLRPMALAISDRPIVVVVGNEGEGLSEAALEACTHRARIPLTNNVDSLNVATAAAIALYELYQLQNPQRRR
jgi:tRNA G18 (ribose-2'-O)-methylase SpoU